MEATTITTIVMVLFALGLLAIAGWAWFSDWQPEVRRAPDRSFEAEYEAALAEMRQAMEDYEAGRRTL